MLLLLPNNMEHVFLQFRAPWQWRSKTYGCAAAAAAAACPKLLPFCPCNSLLQNLATMFTQVNIINQDNPQGQRLFPRAAVAVGAASDNSPAKLDVASTIKVAEATGQRASWAEVTQQHAVAAIWTGYRCCC